MLQACFPQTPKQLGLRKNTHKYNKKDALSTGKGVVGGEGDGGGVWGLDGLVAGFSDRDVTLDESFLGDDQFQVDTDG